MATTTPTTGKAPAKADIEAEIAAARERLAGNLADLIDQVHPRAIVHNTVADARRFVAEEVRQVADQFVDEDGTRTSRVVLAAAAVAGAVGFVLIVRSILSGR
ncbi:MAG TPA: DUF3618 domain-containing protein [Propionicimonas sp.]|jgi:Protein of unknown function (DUF3618)|nr:DUF3618 domain-containing protein [Propionicimonas sp.]